MIIIIPDGKSLDPLEDKMTAEDFKSLMSDTHESNDDVLVINECVNLTMPLIDSTYVNHHLDKSVLQVMQVLSTRTLIFQTLRWASHQSCYLVLLFLNGRIYVSSCEDAKFAAVISRDLTIVKLLFHNWFSALNVRITI